MTHLNAALLFCPPLHGALRALEVLELEYSRVVARQVFVRVPWTGPERPQASIPLEPSSGRDVERGVNLVRELRVVLLFPFSIPPFLQPFSPRIRSNRQGNSWKKTHCRASSSSSRS